jgi:hypothetical protein
VTISIRDGDFIALHVNDYAGTRAAFEEHLKHYTSFLSQVGASRLISASRHIRTPAVYVFLAQEIERQEGNESLLDSVTDAPSSCSGGKMPPLATKMVVGAAAGSLCRARIRLRR